MPGPPETQRRRAKKKSPNKKKAMVGLIRKSGFVTDLRKVRMKEMGELFTPAQIKKHLRDRHYMIPYNLLKAGKNASK